MVDTKTVDGVVVPLDATEQAEIDAKRVLQVAREARTDDQVAEQDFTLDLDGHDPIVRAAVEVLAIQAGFTLANFRDAVKARLIARNFYR